MSVPDKCIHGIQLGGKDAPRCVECDTVMIADEGGDGDGYSVIEFARKFTLGDRVTKTKGSSWTGKVVGFYSTTLTPTGYCVESENEPGSVQIYPEAALDQCDNRQCADCGYPVGDKPVFLGGVWFCATCNPAISHLGRDM